MEAEGGEFGAAIWYWSENIGAILDLDGYLINGVSANSVDTYGDNWARLFYDFPVTVGMAWELNPDPQVILSDPDKPNDAGAGVVEEPE